MVFLLYLKGHISQKEDTLHIYFKIYFLILLKEMES